MMVIVEGPHGTGKTTLSNQLSIDLQLPCRTPFTGHRGRGDYLIDKVADELRRWPDPKYGTAIYDTHPFIDEWVYGPLHRNRLSEGFEKRTSIQPLLDFFFEQALIIYCRPPNDLIEDDGVTFYDFILRYPLVCAHVEEYDYTDRNAYRRVYHFARHHWRAREGIAA